MGAPEPAPGYSPPMISNGLLLPLSLLLACTNPASGPSQTPAAADPTPVRPGEDEPTIDERAERVLWRMGRHLAAAKGLELRAHIQADEAHPSGQWVQVERTAEISVHRERGMRTSVSGDLGHREMWCDLETAGMYDPESGFYSLVEVPGDLDGALDHLLSEYGFSWPLADLAYSDPFVTMIEGVELGSYVGLHTVGDTTCHHLAFRQESIDWQIWVDAGPHPLPRKIVINYRGIEGMPRYSAVLADWRLDSFLPEVMFEFDLPADAVQIEMESLGDQ